MVPKVYFASARVPDYRTWWLPKASMLHKMKRVFYAAGLDGLCSGEVAVKLHMGEPGDTHYLRPAFTSTLVDLIKDCGGSPTVIETSGMGWIANRTSEEKHLEAARRNGFTEETLGAPIRMIDGGLGLDSIPGSIVARGMMDYDAMIVLSHVTGHIQAGFGGAIKNMGLGCVTKAGKYRVHHRGRPKIDESKCTRCGECTKICPSHAIHDYNVTEDCTSCSLCLDVCEPYAIKALFNDPVALTKAISENAARVLGKIGRAGFLNLAIDILPHCDCHPFSDIPMVPDIGVLASLDPVAVDRASIDAVNASSGCHGSSLDDISALEPGTDKFTKVNLSTSWRAQLDRAVELGIGSQRYNMETVH